MHGASFSPPSLLVRGGASQSIQYFLSFLICLGVTWRSSWPLWSPDSLTCSDLFLRFLSDFVLFCFSLQRWVGDLGYCPSSLSFLSNAFLVSQFLKTISYLYFWGYVYAALANIVFVIFI